MDRLRLMPGDRLVCQQLPILAVVAKDDQCKPE
jgi:hypothetical protein